MQSEQAQTLKRLAALIAEKNKQHNLTSAKTATEVYENHINDCVQAFKKTQKILSETVIDCGSGAGLPGLVWAILDTSKSFYTVDSTQKKTSFQKLAIRELDLQNVIAVNDRIQNVALEQENTIVFKAFSSLKEGVISINKKNNHKNMLFLKKDDEKTKQEILEVSSLLYDYKRHEYESNDTKMLVIELYDS